MKKNTKEAFDPLHRIRLLEQENEKFKIELKQYIKKVEMDQEIRKHYETERRHLKKLIMDATALLKGLKEESKALEGTGAITQEKVNKIIEESRHAG